MSAYYNENDAYAAAWLRNLVKAGLIADGYVDERSIRNVRPMDLWGFNQCHFFAGIGVWSAALRAAGVSDNSRIWTGSCPCQPFSGAGERRGFDDERHLWPVWKTLIEECCPPVVLGEQVDGGDGLAWLDLVQADLEGMDYACGAAVAPAAGFGAPHGRHRIWFVAHATEQRWRWTRRSNQSGAGRQAVESGRLRATGALGDTPSHDERWLWELESEWRRSVETRGSGRPGELGDTNLRRRPQGLAAATLNGHRYPTVADGGTDILVDAKSEQARISRCARERRATAGFWEAADWIPCQGGKWRPVEPGTFPLAHGITRRVEQLRAYGNAVVLPAATAFIKAALGAIGDTTC